MHIERVERDIPMPVSLEQIRLRRADIDRLARQYGASNVRIFGSVARGDTNPESDVDVLVRFGSESSLFDQAGLQLDLAELLKCKVDVVSEGGISPYLRNDILAEAVPL